MPGAHRVTDERFCSAVTVQQGNSTVFCNGKLWAVDGDPNSHAAGNLQPITGHSVFCQGKEVIVAVGDTCYNVDGFLHPPAGGGGGDDPKGKSPDVFAY